MRMASPTKRPVVVSNILLNVYTNLYLGKIPILTNMFQLFWNNQLEYQANIFGKNDRNILAFQEKIQWHLQKEGLFQMIFSFS